MRCEAVVKPTDGVPEKNACMVLDTDPDTIPLRHGDNERSVDKGDNAAGTAGSRGPSLAKRNEPAAPREYLDLTARGAPCSPGSASADRTSPSRPPSALSWNCAGSPRPAPSSVPG